MLLLSLFPPTSSCDINWNWSLLKPKGPKGNVVIKPLMCPCQSFSSVRKWAAEAPSWHHLEKCFCVDISRWCSGISLSHARAQLQRPGEQMLSPRSIPGPAPVGTQGHLRGSIQAKGEEKLLLGEVENSKLDSPPHQAQQVPGKPSKQEKSSSAHCPLQRDLESWKLPPMFKIPLFWLYVEICFSHVICTIDSKGMWQVTGQPFLRWHRRQRRKREAPNSSGDAGVFMGLGQVMTGTLLDMEGLVPAFLFTWSL